MNAIDRWWNERFPPYSPARLVFLLVATPVVSAGVVLQRGSLTGDSGSWLHWLMLTLAGQAVVALGWFLARGGWTPAGSVAGHADDEEGWSRGPAESGEQRTRGSRYRSLVLDRPRPEPRSLTISELLGSWAMLFLAVSFLVYRISPEDGLAPMQLLIDAGISGLVLLLVITSFSLTVIVMIAGAISYPIAELLRLFFYFLSGDESVWGYWIFTFGVAMSVGLPAWMQIKALKRQRRWPDLPLWATSAGTATLVFLAALTLGGDFGPDAAAREATQVSAAEARAQQQRLQQEQMPVGAPFPEQAARQFLSAWSQRYIAGAARVATPSVVGLVTDRDYDRALVFEGCQNQGEPQTTCTARSPRSLLTLTVLEGSPSHYIVVAVREE